MRFELKKGRVVYWVEIVRTGTVVDTKTSGHTNKPATSRRRAFDTETAAVESYEAQVAKLLALGYRDPNTSGATPSKVRNPDLEAAIRANPQHPGAYDVYADWLQERGSVHGELIALARANKRTAVAKLIEALELPGENLARFGWRWGMWEWLALENATGLQDFDAAGFAERVFEQPMCAALEELQLGMLQWDNNYEAIPAVIDVAKRHAWARQLARLRIGDVEEFDMAHITIGDVGAPISSSFPGLRYLWLHSGAQRHREHETFGLTDLDLPELRQLVIESCSLSADRLAAVIAAKLPSLRRLELWFGSERYGCDAGVAGLARMLSGQVHTRVVNLGLRNSEFANAIAEAVAGSPIAGRLEFLDLSMGTLTDEGADALIAGRKAFGRLSGLALDDSYLSPAGERAIKRAFPFATTSDQKAPDTSIPGQTYYYVSVAE